MSINRYARWGVTNGDALPAFSFQIALDAHLSGRSVAKLQLHPGLPQLRSQWHEDWSPVQDRAGFSTRAWSLSSNMGVPKEHYAQSFRLGWWKFC